MHLRAIGKAGKDDAGVGGLCDFARIGRWVGRPADNNQFFGGRQRCEGRHQPVQPLVGNEPANKQEIAAGGQAQARQNFLASRVVINVGAKGHEIKFAAKCLLELLARENIVENHRIMNPCGHKRRKPQIKLGVPRPFVAAPVWPVLAEKSLFAEQPQHRTKNRIAAVLDMDNVGAVVGDDVVSDPG